jgi:hypothetical protein
VLETFTALWGTGVYITLVLGLDSRLKLVNGEKLIKNLGALLDGFKIRL